MFQDSKSGQTHFENDGCGEPAHNKPEKWEEEFHHLFEILTDSGKNLVNGRDDFEYWSFHDSLKSFIRQAISEAVEEEKEKSMENKELEMKLAELWDAISEAGGGSVWLNLTREQWTLARDLFELKLNEGESVYDKNVVGSNK